MTRFSPLPPRPTNRCDGCLYGGSAISEIHSYKPVRRAVVIEDDPDFAARLTGLLSSLEHDVVVRLDSSASETYEIRDTDVVFLDLLMPHVAGVQVLEQLERQNAKSPIVLMSGNDHFLREAEETINKLHLALGDSLQAFRFGRRESVIGWSLRRAADRTHSGRVVLKHGNLRMGLCCSLDGDIE